MSDALITALLTNPATYQMANPTTTPDDYKLLLESIRRMPERPMGQVRIQENAPEINGSVNANETPDPATGQYTLNGPPEIFISRLGQSYASKDPGRIAGTLHHENTHLKGGTEAEAREAQRKFVADSMKSGQMVKDKGYLRQLSNAATLFAGSKRRVIRNADMEQALLLQALKK